MLRNAFEEYIKETFNINPEYPWVSSPDFAVFRHNNNRKWFAVVMEIPKSKIGLIGEEKIDVVNLKCDTLLIGSLMSEKGIYRAYHMNKNHWITVCLDGSVEFDKVKWLLGLSYDLTNSKIPVRRKSNDDF